MQFSSDFVKQKETCEVELKLTDGSVMRGAFFLHARQRIIDIMNDERSYVPFVNTEGVVTIVNKSFIWHVMPVDQTIQRSAALVGAVGRAS